MLQLLRAPIPTTVEAAFVTRFCQGTNINFTLKYFSEGMTCFDNNLAIHIRLESNHTVTVMYFSPWT